MRLIAARLDKQLTEFDEKTAAKKLFTELRNRK